MIELTGLGSVLRGLGFLYWTLAVGLLVLALWKGKGGLYKAFWAGMVIVVFGYLPVKGAIEQARKDAYAREAWAYFKKKCDTAAGEKIYRTFTGVKSVLVVKPLPPASDKDNYDQFWYGDPYSGSATSNRGTYAATRLVLSWKHRDGIGAQRGLDFVELKESAGNGYVRIHRPKAARAPVGKEQVERAESRFGVMWEDISTPEDRKYWVASSRFRVIDLTDGSVVAERIGYLIEAGFGSKEGARRPWLVARGFGPNRRSCPYAGDATDQWFLTSVFIQEMEK